MDHPTAQVLPFSTGEAISRFRDDVDEITNLIDQILWMVASSVSTITAIIVMANISLFVTLFVFLPIASLVTCVQIANSRIKKYRQASRKATREVTGMISEMFSTVQAIQLAGAEMRVIDHFRTLNQARRRTALTDTLLTALLDTISQNIMQLGTGLILLFIGGLLQTGRFTVGDFALFVAYLVAIAEFPRRFGMVLSRYKQAAISLERLQDLLVNATPETLVKRAPVYLCGPLPELPIMRKAPTASLECFNVTGLAYHYPDSSNGIEDVSFCLKQGQFVVITGRVGAGKTTLLRVLLGLLPREAGEICWNDQRIADPGTFLVPPVCGYTAQVSRLFSETLKANILLGLPDDESDVCGFGWRAYDLAVFSWGAALSKDRLGKSDEDIEKLWTAFLHGYLERRHLSEVDIQAIPVFVAIRHIWFLGIHPGNWDNWGYSEVDDRFLDRELAFLHKQVSWWTDISC